MNMSLKVSNFVYKEPIKNGAGILELFLAYKASNVCILPIVNCYIEFKLRYLKKNKTKNK